MSATQASEYKFEISRINKELRDVKKKVASARAPTSHHVPLSVPTRAITRRSPHVPLRKVSWPSLTCPDPSLQFYEQRKREQHVAEQRRTDRAMPTELLVQEARASLNRFTGGGFNLNMPAS